MRCRWPLFAIALLCAGTVVATAQPPVEPKDGKYVVPLTVDAVAPVRPALKYRLLPDIREVQPGNQIPAFYKCFFEQNHLFYNKESTDKQQKWLAAPLKDLVKEKELVNYGGSAVKQAFYAARLDTVDWQLLNQMKSDGIGLLLPDVQQMRMLTAVLKVRARGEIARGELDAAVQTLQTQFALARIFNEQPTLVGHLVGVALAMVALGEVEEFVQQPGAPNLFWPLTDLPTPFIDLRKGIHVEKLLVPTAYNALRKAEPISEEALGALVKQFDTLLGADSKIDMLPSAWYSKQAKDKTAVSGATERLVALGHKAADLPKLSAFQVIVMDDHAQYEAEMDELAKWTNVPFWQIPPDFGQQKPRSGAFAQLLPAYYKVMLGKMRLHQNVALLTVAEGVRAHAADNGGKLPATLDAVKLPLPVDPVTGKPFVYERKDGTAVIRGTPPPGREKEPTFNRVYEVTVRK